MLRIINSVGTIPGNVAEPLTFVAFNKATIRFNMAGFLTICAKYRSHLTLTELLEKLVLVLGRELLEIARPKIWLKIWVVLKILRALFWRFVLEFAFIDL